VDNDPELFEIEYGYVTRDRRILVRATRAEIDALVAEVAQRGWQVRPHPVDEFGIADGRATLLADLERR
jgi:hypothetical protein